MAILFNSYSLPDEGNVEINVNVSFDISIPAKKAQRLASEWLMNEVSYLLRGLTPTLCIGEQIVWRIPVSIGYPDLGQVGVLGTIKIDVQTGELLNSLETKSRLERRAVSLSNRLPLFERSRSFLADHVAPNVSPAPQLTLPD